MESSARHLLVCEARELLADMEKTLLDMELDGGSAELINASFRAAHTIKGSAGLFGLERITSFAQVLENVLERVRSRELAMRPDIVSTLLNCCDYIGLLVSALEQETEDLDPDPAMRAALLNALHLLMDASAGKTTKALTVAQSQQSDARAQAEHWHISLRFGQSVLKNGMDPLSFFVYLRSLGTIVYLYTSTAEIPAAPLMDPELCYLGFELGIRTSADLATLQRVFDFVRDDSQVQILGPRSNAAEYIQIINALPHGRKLGELLVASGALRPDELHGALNLQASVRVGEQPRLGEVLVAEQLVLAPVVAAALTKQKQGDERQRAEHRLVKVDSAKLDQLINMVGELVISSEGARLMATRARQTELVEAMGRVTSIVEHVRDRALDMRMVPIGEVFQRFPRVVRDVAKELGKEIELKISGAESELDKSMVDRLSDPLLHLVRNAIDHGIEPVAERKARGKRPEGRLHLHAFHESGAIVIEIKDDGRGLLRDQILAKAVERGLIAEGEKLSDPEIYQLLFLPGFSTAQQVTSLSGRGVGMDVVKRNVEQLRGAIEIATRAGQGTRFRIRLPLTLAIIDGFQVALDDTVYVLPLQSVVECVHMTAVAASNQNLVSLRGEPLPYLRLREVFELAPFSGARESLVVVKQGRQRIGLVVDRLLGDAQAVIKPLGALFRSIKAVSSSTILGDGTVALILDVGTLVARASEASSGSSVRSLTH